MFESTIISGQIHLGKQGEHCARRFSFNDVVIWKEIFGEGRCELIHQRNGDSAPYPVALTVEDGIPYWCVSEVDTAYAGMGKCEVRYIVDDTIVKSNIYVTFVQEALGEETTEAPEPQKAWVDQVIKAGNEAKQSAEQAVDSANNAEVAKSASEAYAEQSRTYAQTAEERAEFADIRARDSGIANMTAQSAAEQARGYANEAKGYADSASANAQIAIKKAEEATEDATFVKDAVNGINATFANALKGVVSGVGAVRMDDMSPLPHKIEVKTDIDTGFKSYGKNIVNHDTTWGKEGSYRTLDIPVPCDITISYKRNSAQNYYSVMKSNNGLWTSGNRTLVGYLGTPTGVGAQATLENSLTIKKEDGYEYKLFTNESICDADGNYIKGSNLEYIQVEVGGASKYEEYKEPVDGAVLVHPTTTLVADNTDAKIEATYNRDINKAFAELTAAMISLGGNI